MTRDARRPAPAADLEEPALSPARPAVVELAAAILLGAGGLGLLGAILGGGASGSAVGDAFLPVTVALNVGSMLAGLLVRLGRLWLVVVNYVAVLGFLDLLAAGVSPLALMLGLADIVVVIILFMHKGWFDQQRVKRDRRISGPPVGG